MLKKILSITAKIILGVFIFYVVLGFILIPLALTFIIPSQGKKILKHSVAVRSVNFNPFMMQLTVKDFEIRDNQKQVMVGFKNLFVDVSFVSLMKKIYHVEAITLDGLYVNVELMPDGHINLMDLIPPAEPSASAKTPSASGSAPAQSADKQESLPPIVIDTIDINKGEVRFTERSVTPNFSTIASGIELHVQHFSTDPAQTTKVQFESKLDGKGKITLDATAKPFAKPLQMESSVTMDSYAMTVLTPYTGKYTGHTLKDGKLDLRMDYRIADNKISASHKLTVQHFEFGDTVESKDALHLPFSLAVAILEDPQGRIKINLPVSGDMSDPKFDYGHVLWGVVHNFFMKIITKPFAVIGSMLGGSDSETEEFGYVRFAPGKATLSDEEQKKLKTLIKGLNEHPKLRLEINGSYDRDIDWKAIQFDIFTKDYETLKKNSQRSESKVYQQLYQRRFGIRELWALAKKYKASMGKYDDEKLMQEIKHQLIENAPPDQGALGILAQARAQGIYDFLIASGFEASRLNLGTPKQAQSSMGFVPLEFTLTVFEQ